MSCIQALRRPVAMFAVTSLLLGAAACDRRNGSAGDGTTVPTEVTTTETVATTEPPTVSYEVPDVIDAAYVETVMRALDHIYGEAVRIMARDRRLSDEFLHHLSALYTDRFFDLAVQAWAEDLQQGLPRIAENPGNPRTNVKRLVKADRTCVVAEVDRDLSPIVSGAANETPQRYVAMIPMTEGRDVLNVNPTPWILTYDGFTQSGVEPSQPCRPV